MPRLLSPLSTRALLWGLALLAPVTEAAEPNVYRCTAADGSTEFRQFPCHGRDEGELLEIDNRPSGWTPPDPADVFPDGFFTDARESKARESSTQSDGDARKDAAADRRWQEKCLKKQHQLDDVQRQLRAGYTASEGQRLKHKRAQYEEYIEKFCE